jgi:PKD repeat protein
MSKNRFSDPFEDHKENGHLKKAVKREIPRIISSPHYKKRFEQIAAYTSELILASLLIFLLVSHLTQTAIAAQALKSDFSDSMTSGCSQLAVTFTDKSIPKNQNDPIVKWEWDFNGDGVIEHIDTAAPAPFIYTYTTPGTYTVTLKITAASGQTNTMTKTDYITAYGPPTANFTAIPNSGCPPLTVAFTNTSKSNGRIITGWDWDFGDSTTYNGQAPPAHIYSNRGTYTVKLTVTSACGTDTKIAYVTVSQPVVVPGTYGPACVSGSNITLSGSPGGGTWFGDGVSGNIFNPTVAGPGNHVLTYQYTSGSSCSFSNTTTLTVVPLPQTTITVE